MSGDLIFSAGMVTGAIILTTTYFLTSYWERKRK